MLKLVKNISFILFVLSLSHPQFKVLSQNGGQYGYVFLNSSFNSRTASLGNDFITIRNDDINFAMINPANLDSTMSTSMAWNHAILPAGINKGSFAYAHHKKDVGTFAGYINYLAYGKMEKRDVIGNYLGEFNPADMVIGASYSRMIVEGLSVGASTKFVMSFYEAYSSFGMAFDLGVNYYHEKSGIHVAAMARNMGFQFYNFQKNNQQPLPINLITGISYKLPKAPFRLSVHFHDLQNWNLNNVSDEDRLPIIDPITGDTTQPKGIGFGEELMRHITPSIEVLVGKSFYFNLAFDYNKRKQLQNTGRPGLAGFSFGMGFGIRQIKISYALQSYNVNGYANFFSLSTNLNSWKKGSYNYIPKKEKKKKKKDKKATTE